MARKQTGAKNKPKNGDKKKGREKRKKLAKGNPISLFVRGKITAHTYWTMAGISAKV